MCILKQDIYDLLRDRLAGSADQFARSSGIITEGFIDRCERIDGFRKMELYLDKVQFHLMSSSEGDTYVFLIKILLNLRREDLVYKLVKMRLDA